MSTFPGYIPELPGIAIDYFDHEQRQKATVFFLSHCHADHMRGLAIEDPLPGPLYLSPISGVFIRHRFVQHAKVTRNLIAEERLSLTVNLPNKTNYELTVVSIPAEHCPGSVMFYFETVSSRILYTGDFRSTSSTYLARYFSEIRPVIVYLDSTFLNLEYDYFPTRDEATEKITELCSNFLADERNVVSLWLPANCGSEDLFLKLFEGLGEKIHVNEKQRGTYMHFPNLCEALTGNSSARIHACTGTVKHSKHSSVLACRTLTSSTETIVRIIRPSALRWKGLQQTDEHFQETHGLFYVCYSNHASYSELVKFLQYFKPGVQEVRLNTVADESDLARKTQLVNSILLECDIEKRCVRKCDTIQPNESLYLDKMAYKNDKHVIHHHIHENSGSESDHSEDEYPNCNFPKRMRCEAEKQQTYQYG
ncbi:protein artemis-like [Anopheles cruzii]|uniref:protein artemis-like n=1 Tax=Anopheles cruzii TaxID=68878 RepID=UPI0022EC2247|nr:protein artemis-like [Anopheles cruzii]